MWYGALGSIRIRLIIRGGIGIRGRGQQHYMFGLNPSSSRERQTITRWLSGRFRIIQVI